MPDYLNGLPPLNSTVPLHPDYSYFNLAKYGNNGNGLSYALPQTSSLSTTGLGGGDAPAGMLDWFKGINWLDKKDANGVTSQGALGPTLGVATGLFNAWMGMKQYGLAKDQLSESKRQFQLNYDAQRDLTNSQLEDRQRARVASNSGAYQSVGDYMAAHGIKGG